MPRLKLSILINHTNTLLPSDEEDPDEYSFPLTMDNSKSASDQDVDSQLAAQLDAQLDAKLLSAQINGSRAAAADTRAA